MAKLVILFACLALFHLGNALQCYNCDEVKCELDKSQWAVVQKCGGTADPTKNPPACLKHVYKDNSGKEMTIRKCIIGPDYKCTNKGVNVACDTCTSDLCNSASSISSKMALFGLILVFAQKFL